MIEVENLSKSYGSLRAVDNVSFQIAPDRVVGFLGPNGAGKSTTLRILAGYQPADSGSARVAGFDVFSQSMRVRERIGYLPESTPLYSEMRVREYLRFRGRLKRIPSRSLDERIDAVRQKCWLSEFINRPISQLSKGMRQRVGLADALIHNPPVVFLDEPTIGLDPTQIRETRNLIAGLAQEHTVLLSSHILSEVEATCGEVIIIARGKVVAQGSPAELRAQVVQASELIAEIAGNPQELQGQLKTVPGVENVQLVSEDNGWCRLRIRAASRADVRESISALVCQKGWKLRELRREVASLEDFFVKIVAQEEVK